MTKASKNNKNLSATADRGVPNESLKKDDNSFTMVSHQMRQPNVAHTPARSSGTSTNVAQVKERSPVRTRSSDHQVGVLVTISTFGAFHFRIFPVIQHLVSQSKDKNDNFVKKWRKITSQGPTKVTESSSFRTVAKALGINERDIHGYRDFLVSCPNISSCLKLEDGTVPHGFLYYLNNAWKQNDKSVISLGSSSGDSTNSANSALDNSTRRNADTSPAVTQEKVDELDEDITDPASTQMSDGDEELTDPVSNQMADDEVTSSTLKTTLEDVTVDSGMDDNKKTDYAYATCYNNTGDFMLMMQEFWPAIRQFIADHPQHEHSKQWRLWIDDGFQPGTDLAEVKQITGLSTLDQIYLFLRDSPALQEHFDIVWDHKINYRQKRFTGSPTRTPTRDNTYRHSANQETRVIFEHFPTSFQPFHRSVFDLIDGQEIMEPAQRDTWDRWYRNGLRANTNMEDVYNILQITSIHAYIGLMYQFSIFGDTVIINWAPTRDSFSYIFKSGVHLRVSTPRRAGTNRCLDLPNLPTPMSIPEAYMKAIGERLTRLEERFNSFDTLYYYTQANEVQTSVKSLIHEELHSLDVALRRKSIQFQSQMDKMIDTLLKEVYAASNDGHAAMAKEFEEIMDKIKQSTSVINDFMPYVSELPTIKDELVKIQEMRDQLNTPPHSFSDHRSVHSQPAAPTANRWTNTPSNPPIANRWINFRTKAQAQQADTTSTGKRDHTIPLPVTSVTTQPNPSQRSTNIPNFRPNDNSGSTGKDHAATTTQAGPGVHNGNSQGYPIPHTVHLNSGGDPYRNAHINNNSDPHDLPPVNHDAAIKRAKIQYTGLGDLFVFYNQLLNGMEQFGIYLSPLDNVRYQESVCPAEYNSFPITPRRYRMMASTLYQKLQNPDVIPHEHTAIRHIINRYAEQNDGYKVLYAMLELIHPALHQDAVLLPPKSNECNEDIHLYAQKFDSWLKYEAYANRPYSARETVNLFLRELSPHFAPAVSRIRRLMDTWNQYDPHVPEPLRITSLPVTIERYMNEETNTPYIRRMHHPASPHKGGRLVGPAEDKNRDARPSQDKTCRLCGGYGHDDEHCDFTAKWMNVQDASKKVDARLKEKLKDQYKLEQQKRRSRKLRKKVGIIRQMLDDGTHPDAVDDALAALPGLMDSQADISDTDSEPSNEEPSQEPHA